MDDFFCFHIGPGTQINAPCFDWKETALFCGFFFPAQKIEV